MDRGSATDFLKTAGQTDLTSLQHTLPNRKSLAVLFDARLLTR